MSKWNPAIVLFLFIVVCMPIFADWQFYEETHVNGSVSGTVKKETTDSSGGHDPNTLFSGVAYPEITLDTLMPKEVQKKAGIQKLDKNEKEYLRKFLIDYYMLGIKQRANETSVSKPLKRPRPSVIESQIVGDFEGWRGATIIRLLNAQIWQQIEYYYTYHYAFMPKVFIYKSASGYKMKVDGVDKTIGVKQIQ